MDVQTLSVSPRAVTGKKVKQLRRQGFIPVHMYGSGTEPLALQAEAQALRRLIPRVGANIPVSVQVEGRSGENICFVREVQRHPVTEDLLHVDFLRVDVTQTVTAEVPVVLEGHAPATREGGTLLQNLQSVEVEGLPMDIPPSIHVDVSGLDNFEKAIHVSDLQVPGNVTILTEPDEIVARVAPPRVEVEEAVPEEAVEEAAKAEEAAEAAEGEKTEE